MGYLHPWRKDAMESGSWMNGRIQIPRKGAAPKSRTPAASPTGWTGSAASNTVPPIRRIDPPRLDSNLSDNDGVVSDSKRRLPLTANLPVASRSKVDPLNVKRLQADGPYSVGVSYQRLFFGACNDFAAAAGRCLSGDRPIQQMNCLSPDRGIAPTANRLSTMPRPMAHTAAHGAAATGNPAAHTQSPAAQSVVFMAEPEKPCAPPLPADWRR